MALFSPFLSFAHDEDILYTFSEDEIKALNANTLADLVRYIPFISTYYEGSIQKGDLGVHDLEISAVYRDDVPIFMDQNVGSNLQLIGLEQIVKVEFRGPGQQAYTKNQTSFNIYLYSREIDQKSSSFSLELGNSSNNDFPTRLAFSASNKQHSLGIGFNRYFENGVKLVPEFRKFDWASFVQYDASIKYRYQYFNKANITLNYRVGIFDQLNRSNIVDGTSRAKDDINFTSYNWLGATINTKLSRTHKLSIIAQYAINNRYRYTKEQDLSTGRSELLPVANENDSVSYRHSFVRAAFEKDDTTVNYGYTFGIEFSNLQDRIYNNIEAIKIGYTDYVIFASTFYKPIEQVQLDLGIHYITNSLTDNYILPRGQLRLRANPNFSVRVKYLQSLVYPQIYQLFYNSTFTQDPIENNLQLQAAVLSITNFQLFLNYPKVRIRTGMNFSGITEAVTVNHALNTWNNNRESRDLATYIAIDYNYKGLIVSPVVAIHGLNRIADTINRMYFMPEFTLKASYFLEELQFGIYAYAKFLGTKNIMETTEDGVLVNEYQSYKLLDVAVSKFLLNRKLAIRAGFNNIFNEIQMQQNVYSVENIDQNLIAKEFPLINRGRNYFIRITLEL